MQKRGVRKRREFRGSVEAVSTGFKMKPEIGSLVAFLLCLRNTDTFIDVIRLQHLLEIKVDFF